jgi:hypothetical protein
MRRRWIGTMAVATAVAGAVTAVAVAAPPAGTPDVSKMAITANDVPGAQVVRQTGTPSTAATPAYLRALKLTKPYGASHYTSVVNTVVLEPTAAQATARFAQASKNFSSPKVQAALRKQLLASVAKKGVKVSLSIIRPRALKVGDSAVELGVVMRAGSKRTNASFAIFRVDRVLYEDVASGSGAVVDVNDATALGKLVEGHVDAALAPTSITAPAVSGTAQQGQTLTASNGTWGGSPTGYAYQWQRCDASGANCADIAGATGSTYAVGSGDVGSTLRVSVTATNKFGSVAAPSAVTAAVT